MEEQASFQCPECGLHYESEEIAKACEEFCKENNACSLEIAKHSIEVSSTSRHG